MKTKIEKLSAKLETVGKTFAEISETLAELKKEAKGDEAKIESGKWYTNTNNSLFCSNGKQNDIGFCFGYGFRSSGIWIEDDDISSWSENNITPATDKEVEEALIKEAEKRGFKEGGKMKHEDWAMTVEIGKGMKLFKSKTGGLCLSNDFGDFMFYNGKWAEIVENKLTLNGEEVTTDHSTIDIGCIKDMNLAKFEAFVHILEESKCDYVYHPDLKEIKVSDLKKLIE